MNGPALTNKEIEDTLGVGAGKRRDNNPIVITGKCHPDLPLNIVFETEGPSLALICTVCHNLVVRIAIEKTELH